MLYRSRYERGLMEKVKTSREFLDYLRQNILDQSNPMANYLEWEVNQLEACDDSYLAHEMFEPHNHPCYFHQFSTWTRDHGLQYLGDAETGRHLWGMLPEQQQADLLNQTSDPTELEQYTDFIVNRMFRKSLICHDNRFLCEDPGPAQMETLHVGGVIRAQNTSFDLTAGRPETFLTPNGTLAFSEPIEKAVFAIAGIHPEGLLFPRLIDTIEEALPLISRPERRVLEQRAIDILLASFRHGLVTLTLD